MILNQTKYYEGIVTSPLNVNDISPLDNNLSDIAIQKDPRDDVKKVKILVKAIYDIMKIYGYNDKKNLSHNAQPSYGQCVDFRKKTLKDKLRLEEIYLEYVAKVGPGSWKDLFKYKINAFFSYVMEQEIPPAPPMIVEFPDLLNPATISYGRGKRFIRNMDKETLESFAQSVAQSKKGAPPVSPEMVYEAEVKTFKHLTTPREDIPDFEICDGDYDFGNFYYPINRETICFQLKRTVREIFHRKVPSWDELTKPFVPSSSSQYNFNRKGMGAIGAFKSNEAITNSYEKQVSFVSKALGPVQLKEELTELYGQAGIEDQDRIDRDFENIMVKDTIALHFNGEELCNLWKNVIYPKMIDEALIEQPHTIVIGLPEPLKVRCITAGPPLTYSVLKPMQKWLWRQLKDQSCFQLIGTPVTSEIVRSQLGRLGFAEKFVSGDYKASTDNLHSWVSECLLETLFEVFREGYEEGKCEKDEFFNQLGNFETLMKRALTGHKLMNPKYMRMYRQGHLTYDEPDLFRDQKEGQLMGSVISFIFLCLANGALCRYAMEISDFENYKLVDRPIPGYSTARLLINGDDCVFPGKEKLFKLWKDITAFGGLESSVGKTFVSDKFLTINSMQFAYEDIKVDWEQLSGETFSYKYNEIKYVNLGLVYGQKKSGTRGKPFYRLGAISRDLHRSCPPNLYDAAFKQFIKANSVQRFREKQDENGKVTIVKDFFGSLADAKVPWFYPEWLGGLGLVPSSKSRSNSEDRIRSRCASYIREGLGNGSIKIATMSNLPEWKFHNLVYNEIEDYAFLENQNFKKVEFDGTERSLESENSKLYQLLVVDQLLTKTSEQLKAIVDEDREELILRRAYENNIKVWNAAYRSVKKGETTSAILDSDLESEKKPSYLSCFDVRIANAPLEVVN